MGSNENNCDYVFSTNVGKFWEKKDKIQTDQLICYADFDFMITLASYWVKSPDFIIIFNLLRLLECRRIIIIAFIIQLLSIVIRKRGGERRAKQHGTGISLRIEETSTLRVISTLFQQKKILLKELLWKR